MLIEKKIWPESFERIRTGEKTFEIRLADWECNPGDVLHLKEWDPKTKSYTGREIKKTATYVGRTKNLPYWPKEDIEKHGLQIIGFK